MICLQHSHSHESGWQKSVRASKRFGFAFAMVATLAACATGPKNPMTAQQIEAIDIDVVDVTILPGTLISWGAGEDAYAESKGCEKPEPETATSGDPYNTAAGENKPQDCDYDALVNSPEARKFMEDRVVAMVTDAFQKQVQPVFQGTAPAKVEVNVIEVRVISGGQSVFVGGSHMLRATLNVVDLASGKTIATNPELFSIAGYGPGGFLSLIVEAASNDPVERLSVGYAEAAKNWIGGGR